MRELRDKTAVVTGAASGIGRALARHFAAQGMQLVLADIETSALAQTAAELEAAGAKLIAVPTDVSQAASMDALAQRARERFGAVHVVCNNAGVSVEGRTWSLSSADWEFVLGVNLWGVIHGIRAFVPQLVAQNEGYVVNTASLAGMTSPAGMAAYCASKHAVVALSETLFAELRASGSDVGVSVLCPGFVATRIHESERNRPPALHNVREPSASRLAHQQRMAELVSAGISPEQVAVEVHKAMLARRFYVFTHAGSEQVVLARARRIAGGENPAG